MGEFLRAEVELNSQKGALASGSRLGKQRALVSPSCGHEEGDCLMAEPNGVVGREHVDSLSHGGDFRSHQARLLEEQKGALAPESCF